MLSESLYYPTLLQYGVVCCHPEKENKGLDSLLSPFLNFIFAILSYYSHYTNNIIIVKFKLLSAGLDMTDTLLEVVNFCHMI